MLVIRIPRLEAGDPITLNDRRNRRNIIALFSQDGLELSLDFILLRGRQRA